MTEEFCNYCLISKSMINKDYLYTEEWEDLQSVRLTPQSLYLYATDPEDRSSVCVKAISPNNQDTTFLEIGIDKQDQLYVVGTGMQLSLSSSSSIEKFIKSYSPSKIYIEVTGMSCRLAAPLMKNAIDNHHDVYIVYSEPQQYLLSAFRLIGINEDLSEACGGVNPIPGFERILPYKEEPLFIALLGFEGGRLSYLLNNKQPIIDNIRPVVGIPGYKLEYPAESFWGNRNPLSSSKCWSKVEYAEANSIVDSYLTLKRISEKNRNPEMVIAPIGTKPHAIGAILYAIKNFLRVEILYDNPTRNLNRVLGVGKTHVCNISKLSNEN